MKNKIILGTANFAKNYGIQKKNLNRLEIKKIINFSIKNKINYFDTAINYKNVSELLGGILHKNIKVVTKIDIKKNIKNPYEFIISEINKSLKKLKIKKFYAVLLHNSDCLKIKNKKKILEALNYLKTVKKIRKFGMSIYTTKELDKYYKFFGPEIIQIPVNIFDQRLLESKWIHNLKKDNVEIHARSIFLQGVLFKSNLPFKTNSNINKQWYYWKSWLMKNKVSPFDACMQFINNQKKIDRFVFGVDNLQQIKQILNFKLKKKINFSTLSTDNEKILHPQNWRKI